MMTSKALGPMLSSPTSKPALPRFGNSPITLSPLSRMFHFFESSYEPGFLALSKTTANVIPRTAITRNSTERQEVLFNELVQGSTLFLALPVTSFVGDRLQSKLANVPRELITKSNPEALGEALAKGGQELEQKLKMAKLGKSMGASAMIAALLVATTYLRNYRTIKRTGFSDYQKVVGLGTPTQPTAEDRAKADQAARKNMRIIQGLLAGGAFTWLGIMGGAGLMARRGKAFSQPVMNKLMTHAAFVGKKSNQVNGPFRSQWQTLLVWGIPSYLGWFLGCRDRYEVIEQTSKFLTFLGGYFVTPKLVNRLATRKYANLIQRANQNLPEHLQTKPAKAGKLPTLPSYGTIKNHVSDISLAKQLEKAKFRQWGSLTGVNFLVAGVLPIVFNMFFSKWRYQRAQQGKAQALSPLSTSTSRLPHKTFNQWVTPQTPRPIG